MIKKEAVKNSEQVKITFVLPPNGRRARISVLGDFNNWDPASNPLIKRNNGTFSTSVTLPVGQRIRFRYYSADGEWFNDEGADGYEPGEYGAENCVVVV
jgi:1,4-alpha-glucan branching enzyme